MQYLAARIINIRALYDKGYITNNIYKKILINISPYIINKYIKNNLLNFVRILNSKKTFLVGHFFGRAPFKKTSFPECYLGKPRYVQFEHLLLPVPQEVGKYLEVRYGNKYMDLPSEDEKKKYPSHAYIIDVNKNYQFYWNESEKRYEKRNNE